MSFAPASDDKVITLKGGKRLFIDCGDPSSDESPREAIVCASLLPLSLSRCANADVPSLPFPLCYAVHSRSPPAPAVLHGLGSSHSFYSAALSLSRLSGSSHPYRLVRYDMDGHGLSPVSQLDAADDAGMLAVEDLVEDLGNVLESVGVDKVRALVGHSVGGMVACAFAARYPSKVDKLGASLSPLSPSSQRHRP